MLVKKWRKKRVRGFAPEPLSAARAVHSKARTENKVYNKINARRAYTKRVGLFVFCFTTKDFLLFREKMLARKLAKLNFQLIFSAKPRFYYLENKQGVCYTYYIGNE